MNITDIVNKFDVESVKDALSSVYSFSEQLGGGRENNFLCPNKLDGCFTDIGFKCVHRKWVDMELETENGTLTFSCKMKKKLFSNTTAGKKPKNGYTNKIVMANIHPGCNVPINPQFDYLILFQYIPFIGCGIVEYNNVKFTHSSSSIDSAIKIDDIKWVIDPYDKILPTKFCNNGNVMIKSHVDATKFNFVKAVVDIQRNFRKSMDATNAWWDIKFI